MTYLEKLSKVCDDTFSTASQECPYQFFNCQPIAECLANNGENIKDNICVRCWLREENTYENIH